MNLAISAVRPIFHQTPRFGIKTPNNDDNEQPYSDFELKLLILDPQANIPQVRVWLEMMERLTPGSEQAAKKLKAYVDAVIEKSRKRRSA